MIYFYLVKNAINELFSSCYFFFFLEKDEKKELEKGILEALSAPTQNDGVDGFLTRLGESLRKMAYRDRARIEIEIMQMVYERECELNINN